MKRSYWIQPTYLIGIDGEGVDDEHGNHHYNLLCASDGTHRWMLDRQHTHCTTDECFDFLFSLPVSATLIGFSFQYDLNMMIKDYILSQQDRDVARQTLKDFQHAQWINTGRYKFRCFPRKWFDLIRVHNGETIQRVKIEDVFSFFQRSFVKVLKEWKVGDPKIVEEIERMKGKRGQLEQESWSDVVTYCLTECDYLVDLYGRFLETFSLAKSQTKVPLGLKGNYGPGAAAGYTLEHLTINSYRGKIPDAVEYNYVRRAYFGGRFDLCEAGWHSHLYQYDINSAYPYHTSQLPCLRHGRWRWCENYREDYQYAIWKVRWQIPFDFRWPPFPWRNKNGAVYYPTEGYGCYWASEVTAALKMLSTHLKRPLDRVAEIRGGWIYETHCDCQPFSFIKEMYELRKEMVAEVPPNPAQWAFKLVYNSIYGKLVQHISNPKYGFQCFTWGGMITAGTRAQILDALTLGFHDVVSVATDGILSKTPLALPGGKEKVLGEWEYKNKGRTFIVMPGIYYFPKGSEVDNRTRGHETGSIDWPELIALWGKNYYNEKKEEREYTYHTKRFIGAGLASMLIKMEQNWTHWVERELRVNFQPKRRHVEPVNPAMYSQRQQRSNERNKALYQKEGRVFWYPTSFIPGTLDILNTPSARYKKGLENAEKYLRNNAEFDDQPD